MKNLYFLAGLPRTGSTLLTSILYQNPLIHTEGASALCGLVWANLNELKDNRHIQATQRSIDPIIRKIPEIYYAHVGREVVIDKCFTWTLDGNIDAIRKYITPKPRFIVMHRPIEDIINSFVGLMERSDTNGIFQFDIDNNSKAYRHMTLKEQRRSAALQKGGVLEMPLVAYETARTYRDQSLFHYVSYKDLTEKPEEVLNGIYDFLDMPRYKHDFKNIKNKNKESDLVWGLKDMHTIKSSIT